MAKQQWFKHKSTAKKAVKTWIKKCKNSREAALYDHSTILLSCGDQQCWDYLVDSEVTHILEDLRYLNWWKEATPLHALKTDKGHLQSFFHSISLSLWGILDSDNHISMALQRSLKQHSEIWRKRLNTTSAEHVQIKDQKILGCNPLPFHVFVIANILLRPIIVVSDETENMQSYSFRGIYLPLMSKPLNCSKAPIFIAYCREIFYPLTMAAVVTESKLRDKYQIIFPLLENGVVLLPIKFLSEVEEKNAGEILQNYLIIKETNLAAVNGLPTIGFMQAEIKPLPEDRNTVLNIVKTMHNQIRIKRLGNEGSIKTENSNLLPQYLATSAPVVSYDPFALGNGALTPLLPGVGPSSSHAATLENQGMNGQEVAELQLYNPSAPVLDEVPADPMLSMTDKRCDNCKAYRSSVKTFPLCHECFEIQNNLSQGMSSNGTNGSFLKGHRSQMEISHVDDKGLNPQLVDVSMRAHSSENIATTAESFKEKTCEIPVIPKQKNSDSSNPQKNTLVEMPVLPEQPNGNLLNPKKTISASSIPPVEMSMLPEQPNGNLTNPQTTISESSMPPAKMPVLPEQPICDLLNPQKTISESSIPLVEMPMLPEQPNGNLMNPQNRNSELSISHVEISVLSEEPIDDLLKPQKTNPQSSISHFKIPVLPEQPNVNLLNQNPQKANSESSVSRAEIPVLPEKPNSKFVNTNKANPVSSIYSGTDHKNRLASLPSSVEPTYMQDEKRSAPSVKDLSTNWLNVINEKSSPLFVKLNPLESILNKNSSRGNIHRTLSVQSHSNNREIVGTRRSKSSDCAAQSTAMNSINDPLFEEDYPFSSLVEFAQGHKNLNSQQLEESGEDLLEHAGKACHSPSQTDEQKQLQPAAGIYDEMWKSLVKCASPVCNEPIYYPEKLCARCVKILKAHDSLLSQRPCCKDLKSENSMSEISKPAIVVSEPQSQSMFTSGDSEVSRWVPLNKTETEFKSEFTPVSITEEMKMEGDNISFSKEDSAISLPNLELEKEKDSKVRTGSQIMKAAPSLLVTSMTTARDTEEAFADRSFNQKFADIENGFKQEALKCENAPCSNFGNRDKDNFCNVCYSVKVMSIDQDFFSLLDEEIGLKLIKCRIPLCSNHGSKEKKYFCNVCYNLIKEVLLF